MRISRFIAFASALVLSASHAFSQAPGIISHQGKLTVSGTNFNGTALFKFALVNSAGNVSYWSDNGTSLGGGIPADPAVSLPVTRGIFSVNLGDTTVANMTLPVPSGVFTNGGVYLRVWVNDGADGWQQLAPDRQIVSVGYALSANTVTGIVPSSSLPSGVTVVSTLPQDPSLLSSGYQYLTTIAPPPWINGAILGAATARAGHSAIWDGQNMLIWGGSVGSGSSIFVNSGGLYDPVADQWQTMSPLNAPDARSGHTTVWTGSSMIIWGGSSTNGVIGTGGKFQSSGQIWSGVTTLNAPAARTGHVAVWTGSRMFVWGGQNSDGLLNDGALYDPSLDQWTTVNTANPPEARNGATAVWAGDRVIVWGGIGTNGALNNGAELVFVSGAPSQWIAMNSVNAPAARRRHSAVWTGQGMIVWGGQNGSALGDGAIFNPVANSWKTLSSVGAPAARFNFVALWTGQEMLVLDGSSDLTDLAGGAAYDPLADRWRTLTTTGSPLARSAPGAVWTGTQALIFGGQTSGIPVGSLQSIVPQPTWYFYSKL
ncbi:MAG TPA: kelch repeat-containing protein [Verrucomicrobiae bacterium]|nr:kelch repeat-containing protein [Verrucomicrobiae bacterium]